MKVAACGTWFGDLITALIVTDMMLQDNLYPNWAPSVRYVCIFDTCIHTVWKFHEFSVTQILREINSSAKSTIFLHI